MPRIVCISDTHGRHEAVLVPDGDVLVHAGDLSMAGAEDELRSVAAWLAELPHAHKVVIAGNHDWLFARSPVRARELVSALTYLEDAGTVAAGLTIWGSPWQPWFHDWAFNLQRGPQIRAKWELIPDGIDILVTHGPPHGLLDGIERQPWLDDTDQIAVEHLGCEELRLALDRVRPRLHVFGHIHEGYGQTRLGDTILVNAAACDADYRPINPPIVVDLP